jgi:hypothetical protein
METELDEETFIETWSVEDLLHYHDPDEDKIAIKNGWITLNFAYPYEIDLDRIKTERDLLAWALHLTTKTWMNRKRLHYFIEKVGKHKNLNIYGC